MTILQEAKLTDLQDGLALFYERIAKRAGFNVTDKSTFKCTSICVSKEIDDYMWKLYRDIAKEKNPNQNDEEIKSTIAMIFLQFGAKRDDSLNPWMVAINDDFVQNGD